MVRMSRWAVTIAAMAICASSAALARDPPFFGGWARNDGRTRIHVGHCGEAVCAVNTWVKPGTPHEKKGDRLALNIDPAGQSRWKGSAFDPQRHQRYSVKVDVSSSSMTTHGCIMGGLMCQNISWSRLGHEK